jgi:hypothetical protein
MLVVSMLVPIAMPSSSVVEKILASLVLELKLK